MHHVYHTCTLVSNAINCTCTCTRKYTHSLKQVVEDFELQLAAGGRPSQLVKGVDTKFRKQIQELHLRYTKVSVCGWGVGCGCVSMS